MAGNPDGESVDNEDNKKQNVFKYTCCQNTAGIIISGLIALCYILLYLSFHCNWPPFFVSFAKALAALFAAICALLNLIKERMQDELDAKKDCAKASANDLKEIYNSDIYKNIKRMRIAEMCLLVLTLAVAAIAI